MNLLVLGEVARGTVSTETTEAGVIGASVAHPAGWSVERERYTLDDTYGFTLWKPEPDPAAHDHGGRPAVRVALAYDLEPGQIEAAVREKLAAYSHLPMVREEVSVGERGHEGVAVGPIPGSTPSTEVYVPVNGRVYQINVYGEELGAGGRRLLSDLRFSHPSRSVGSLGLPEGENPRTYYRAGDEELIEQEEEAREDAQISTAALSGSGVPVYGEKRIGEGCWLARSTFFFQTQHGVYANERWGAERTGWTKIGKPNYWDEYTHGSLKNYGRCKERLYTNDKFAVDYPLDSGDVVFSPFEGGEVTFAGRNYTHRDYGILVVIRADNDKYVSLSAHLSGLAQGIEPGTRVTDETIIGYAGDTGGPNFPVGEPHLHQAFYRYPRYNDDGSPYGGAGLKVVFHHYVGTAAGTGPGVYKFGSKSDSKTVSKGDWISN
ncbi:MAG: M23 family metallopeptidase [Actinobacteria bacterium]|nr:M23 family metallopeptidase [Actinomycetota bacterium]